MAPPLAGKPPFATDLPDSYYEQPDPTPQRRIRQPAPPDPNKRTSAYDTYDDYLTDDEPASRRRRQSGAGALGAGFLNGASDDDDEDEPRKQRSPSPPSSPRHLQFDSKHALLAAAAGVGNGKSPPHVIAAPKPGYVAPIAAFSLPPSPTKTDQPPSPVKVPPTFTNPFDTQPQQPQPTNPFAAPAPRQNPFDPPRQQQQQNPFESSPRQNPFDPPRQQQQQHPTQRQPHPNMYPQQQRINPFLPQPQPRQPQPQYPHPPQMRQQHQHIPHYGSSTPIPSTPHPLQPPMTPITPVFLRPAKERDVQFVDQEPIMRASKEDTFLPSRGQKGDHFWRRFSMVAHEETGKGGGGKKTSSDWLNKTQTGANRMSRWVWLVGVCFILVVGGAIGLGWWVSHNDTEATQPGVLGGSAGETAGPVTTMRSSVAGSKGMVQPTHTVARRVVVVEARATGVPLL
ncbi:hypothetical protein PQX77_008960 [Marasmius sp. AFHP31]|nr:hypothetical protein PQX77_008960 [Marasmius sp. AFHP31]